MQRYACCEQRAWVMPSLASMLSWQLLLRSAQTEYAHPRWCSSCAQTPRRAPSNIRSSPQDQEYDGQNEADNEEYPCNMHRHASHTTEAEHASHNCNNEKKSSPTEHDIPHCISGWMKFITEHDACQLIGCKSAPSRAAVLQCQRYGAVRTVPSVGDELRIYTR